MDQSIKVSEPRSAGPPSWLVLGLLLVLVTMVVVGHIGRYRKFSPIDELQHVDYLLNAPGFEFPGSGDRIGQEAARAETCSRLDAPFDEAVPPCVSAPNTVDVEQLQEQGFNTAYIHPPGFYFVDGVTTRVLEVITFQKIGILTLARLAGLIWAWLAVVFLWLVFKEFGASTWIAAVGILLVMTSGAVISSVSTVNPDGTALAVGAGILWAAARWERTGRFGWLVVLFAALAVITKFSNIAGVGVALAFLLLPAFEQVMSQFRASRFKGVWTDRVRRSRVAIAGASLVAVGAVSLAWRVAQSVLQVVPPNELPMAQPTVISSFPLTAFVNSWRVGISPLQSPWMASFLGSEWMVASVGVVDLALVVGAVAGLFLSSAGSKGRRVAWASIGCSMLFGPLLVAFLFFAQHVNFPIPPRYGLSLVAGLAVSTIPLLRTRWGFRVAVALSVFSTAAVLSSITFPTV
ncbi:hypothetical protein MCEKE4_00745 [Acidimicrobiia bacterium]